MRLFMGFAEKRKLQRSVAMGDMTKYGQIINGGRLISHMKAHFSIYGTKRTVAIAYVFVFIFIAFTIFLAFSPSSTSSSPWLLTDTFTVNSTTFSLSSSSILSHDPQRSHFSAVVYYFFPNSSSSPSSSAKKNQTKSGEIATHKDGMLIKQNQSTIATTDSSESSNKTLESGEITTHKDGILIKQNQSTIAPTESSNKTVESAEITTHKDGILIKQNQSTIATTNSSESSNKTVGSLQKGSDETLNRTAKLNQGSDDGMKSLLNCDFYDGNWVRDESYPLYKPGSCSLIDEQFNCFLNGRPDNGYYKLKWKPKGCTLPRLNGSHMLELLRGKRLVFVGDSLNRNMWESLICILKNSVKDQKKVYEASGRKHFRAQASYSFVFEDYKSTVEFFVTPFLVQEWQVSDKNGTKKETLRLDLISKFADKYKDADIIVFNTGHWWTHDKTSKGEGYYQEGSHVYDVLNVDEAFRKALTTWGKWIDAKVNPRKSLVFFRGYSASHFSGGQWNSGGQCDNETEPITNDAYLSQYPSKMAVLEQVLKGIRTRVSYMNVTKMTDYRKDGHPSQYRQQHLSDLNVQDCSHWCLPGVPDAWNEILYTQLMVRSNVIRRRSSQKRA